MMMKRRTTERSDSRRVVGFQLSSSFTVLLPLLLLVLIAEQHSVDAAFGVGNGRVTSKVFRKMSADSSAMSDIAEAVNGGIYADVVFKSPEEEVNMIDELVGETEKLLVSAHERNLKRKVPSWINTTSLTFGSSSLSSSSPSLLDSAPLSETVSPSSPPLTFQKFLTMQTKRVPVAVRYSAESGMKPYFLTVAKKLKDAHPDIILDKVILPKVEMSGEKAETARPTFEVMVDGKVVIPTVGKKDRDSLGGNIIFVSMQELEVAISRARRRRRPSTVYGEDESNVRLEMLKAKAAALGLDHPTDRNSHKPSND